MSFEQPAWLWLAAVCFVAALLANALAWRATIRLCGGEIGRLASIACYGVGSLVNSAAPARIGDAVRIGLFSRAFEEGEGRERLWTTGGVFTALGAVRALCLGALVLVAAAMGALPLWPLFALGGLVAAAVATAFFARRRSAERAVAHLLDAFRVLGRSPGRGAPTVCWIALATAARLVGVAAIASGLGVGSPFLAAAIIVPALDVAGIVPLTPGNLGVASGTVSVPIEPAAATMPRVMLRFFSETARALAVNPNDEAVHDSATPIKAPDTFSAPAPPHQTSTSRLPDHEKSTSPSWMTG